MNGPRHLWSGDWEDESNAHAEGLAGRRGHPEQPAEPEPVAPAPRENPIRRAIRWFRERLRHVRTPGRRRARLVLLATFLTLLGATAAYAVISDSSSSPKQSPQSVVATGGQAWLGVRLANAGVRGALVSSVAPGSPAAAAGIRPGDLITQLDTEPIVAPAVFVSAISGLQPGDKVDIQIQRGASEFSTQVVLASHPVRTP
jgi:membrane-associated protease RseP (regulator of RpoE activity)